MVINLHFFTTMQSKKYVINEHRTYLGNPDKHSMKSILLKRTLEYREGVEQSQTPKIAVVIKGVSFTNLQTPISDSVLQN